MAEPAGWIDFSKIEVTLDRKLIAAIHQSREKLTAFVSQFILKRPSQSRFLVCGLEFANGKWIPVGVLVERFENDVFYGKRLLNQNGHANVIESAEISFDRVVDWSYIDLWEMQGGATWRAVLSELSGGNRVGAIQNIYRICQLEPPPSQSPDDRKLARSIVESDFQTFATFLPRISLTKEVWASYYSEEQTFTGHSKFEVQELILTHGSLDFVKKCQEALSFDINSGTALCIACTDERPELLEYFLSLGFSPSLPDDLLQTPLIYSARYGNLSSVKRLIGLKVDLDAQDNGGRTALHEATSAEIVDTLLEAGAEPRICTYSKIEPQNAIAKHLSERDIEILKVFVKHRYLDPSVVDKLQDEKTIQERGADAIREYEESIGSDIDEVSKRFRGGVVLPFDYVDPRTGRICFD